MGGYEPRKIANYMAGGQTEPLLPLGNPLLQQAATLGEEGLATVIQFRPLSRAVFSYLQASELLEEPDVRDRLIAKAGVSDVVGALRKLSPVRMLNAAHDGRVPKGLKLVLKRVSPTEGLTYYDATRIMRWMNPGCDADQQRARLLVEALETLNPHASTLRKLDFGLLIGNIRDLPEHSLELLRLRDPS